MSEQASRPSRRKHRTAAFLAVAGLAASASGPHAQHGERYSLAGEQVAIYNIAGELRIEPGSGSAVVVEVSRGGRDAGALQVKTGTRHGIPALVVLYPGRRIVYEKLPGGWSSTLSVPADGMWNDGSDGWSGRRVVTVTGSGEGTRAYADLRVLVPKGKKVVVRHKAGEVLASNVEGHLVLDHGVGRLQIRSHRGELDLDTGSGEVKVSDVRGNLNLDTGSGAVMVSDVQGKELILDSGSGAVRVSDVRVEELNADTGSGSVELRGIDAQRVHLDTGSGSVQLELASDVSDLVVDSGSGAVTVRVPPELGAEFSVETSSGDIVVDVEHEAFEVARRHVRGRIGDGRGTIRIESGSGGVRILPAGGMGGRVGMLGTLLTLGVG